MVLIRQANPGKHARIIDVGGGQSFLVDRLLDEGYGHIAVLDVSRWAIDATKARLGEKAAQVHWFVADITQIDEIGTYEI